jgi:hypothetical protein
MPRVVDQFRHEGKSYQLRLIHCGREKCSKCPHGPYWYVVIQPGTGKTITRYVGKRLPPAVHKTWMEHGGGY